MKRMDFCNDWSFQKKGEEQYRLVDLPHDAMIEDTRSSASPSGASNAYFPGGVYIYEKSFSVPYDWADKHVEFQFEGVYRNAKVFINGKEAGGKPYGYIPFFVNTDGLLKYGENNTIRVEADNSKVPNTRWYSGGGIYRPVWIWIGDKTCIAPQGVQISTLSYSPARIRVEVMHHDGDVIVEILNQGVCIASGAGDSFEVEIPNAKLWSDETPNLYEYKVNLKKGDDVVDQAVGTFGIRKIEMNAKQGLLVNGKKTLLRGGCVHHDNGILGSRSFAASEERRVRIMQQAGFNAIRSAHNPASVAMLEACDRLGVYVIDETWDMWYERKTRFDYADLFEANFLYDVDALIERDFNHPSVIMYSIGNEVAEPRNEKGRAKAKQIIDRIHKQDTNRAVTCGVNLMIINFASKGMGVFKEDGTTLDTMGVSKKKKKKSDKATGSLFFNILMSNAGSMIERLANSKSTDRTCSPFLDMLDAAGYNYAGMRYEKDGLLHPKRVIYGSETMPYSIARNWERVKKHPYLIGDFMWTSWDYLGEAGLGGWSYTPGENGMQKPYPWLLAKAGVIDILGHADGSALQAAAVWHQLDTPGIAVRPVNHPGVKPYKAMWRATNALPSWSWRGCDGNDATVEVYFDAAAIELIQNGKSLGKKKVKGCLASFQTKYQNGTLTAIAYDEADREIARGELASAKGDIELRATAEKENVHIGEAAYVAIDLVGKNGIVESNADTRLKVKVEGGELLAFGSAMPSSEDDYLSGNFMTYFGRAQAVVRAKEAGIVTVTVTGEKLAPAKVILHVEETEK